MFPFPAALAKESKEYKEYLSLSLFDWLIFGQTTFDSQLGFFCWLRLEHPATGLHMSMRD